MGAPLKTIILPDTVTSIGRAAFLGSAIESGLKTIDDYAFAACLHLRKIFLPQGLEHIGTGAFLGCVSLETAPLPDSVKFIGNEAFALCQNLKM